MEIKFAVGDIISLVPDTEVTIKIGRCKAVVVRDTDPYGHVASAVFLDSSVSRRLIEARYAVKVNRGWTLYEWSSYGAQLVADPTDEEVAMAMRILLTSYVPGVDDEEV